MRPHDVIKRDVIKRNVFKRDGIKRNGIKLLRACETVLETAMNQNLPVGHLTNGGHAKFNLPTG